MVTRTFDILEQYRTRERLEDALACKVAGQWLKYSAAEYIDCANDISCGLLAMGLKQGDKIALISNNRPEWNFLDMGMAQIGVVSVPVYTNISLDEYQYIFNHCAPRMLVVSDRLLLEKLRPLFENSTTIEHVYTFNNIEGEKNWKEIAQLGRERSVELLPRVQQVKDSISPDDLFTLIYTSGTTGTPKGVMLSHNNLVTNFKSTAARNYLTAGSRSLSFLPISHIYERMMNYHFQYLGIAIYYAENMGALMDNIKEVQPHIFTTVPRLLERIFIGIVKKGKELKGIKAKLFYDAIDVAVKYNPRRKSKNIIYRLRFMIARRFVFPQWLEALGGQARIIVSGGASLQTRLAKLFCATGIDVFEGYGLTETSPVIAVTDLSKGNPKPGTVGPTLEDVEVKIAEDGEILCKGPNIMSGYYKDPELTAQLIDSDGFFHTGDVGTFDNNNFLKITDRKEDMFKLSDGKSVSPQVVENKMKETLFIDQIFVVGENEKFAGALILPSFTHLHNWCFAREIKFSDNTELINHLEVIELYQMEINHLNRHLSVSEQVKRFRLIADEWSIQTGELSPTLKIKRRLINEKYAEVINEMYSF